MATRISKLKWDEISGVDHPANETPGWILQKAAGEVKDFETAIVELHKVLGSDSAELFFKDADEPVRKAVAKIFKHLDENLEEVDDEDDETDDEEEVKKEKRGIDRLRDIFKLEKSDDDTDDTTSDDDEDDTSEDTDTDADTSSDETDEDESDTDDDEDESDESDEDDVKKKKSKKKTSDDDEDDEEGVEKSVLAKSAVQEIVSALEKELEPIREAVGALADRTENLEKHATNRTSILGQDGSEEEDEDDERAGLHKAITGAIRTGKQVTLT